jgi:hypothetical protein
MTRTTLFRLSIATILGGAALFWGGQLPLQDRPSADADELRWGCAADHAPGRGGRGRGSRCGWSLLCSPGNARMFASGRCLRADRHGLQVRFLNHGAGRRLSLRLASRE